MAKLDDFLDETDDANVSPIQPESATAQMSALVADVTHLAYTEFRYYKTRFAYSQTVLKQAGFFAIMAVAAFFASIAALIFGLLMVVAHYAGPVVATIAVPFGFLTITVIAGLMARRAARNLSFADAKAKDNE
jgi:hypothetical protein